jgi:redox-sensitive bicupin YhaK (pirin superfamily)
MATRFSDPVASRPMALGGGFTAHHLDEARFGGMSDPVLMVDHFRMREPTFAPHPHAGFSAVTYLFEDSPTGQMHYDSLGTKVPIRPGELHWTLAGSGVVHDEPPLFGGGEVHGLQIFVNLRSTNKFLPPRALHKVAAEIPVIAREGLRARVAVGDSNGVRSPLALPEPFTLLDVKLAARARFEHALPASWNALVYVIDGAVELIADCRTTTVWSGTALGVSSDEGVTLSFAAAGDAQFVVLSGAPLAEPIVKHGPFVMNTRAQISQVMRDYGEGRMGRLEGQPVTP